MFYSVTLAVISLLYCSCVSHSQTLVINEFMASNATAFDDGKGNYYDWIELYNLTANSVNLSGYGLSDKADDLYRFTFPNTRIAPHAYVLVFASGAEDKSQKPYYHADFKLSRSGEAVYLTNPQGLIEDTIEFNELPTDISYGRFPDGSEYWMTMAGSSPGQANQDDPYVFVALPIISLAGGRYSDPLEITLQAGEADSSIYYSTDCSDPDSRSSRYRPGQIISLQSTTVLKAVSYSATGIPSRISTQTYFINEPNDLPVISLSTDPPNLWDTHTGIYVPGPSASSQYPYWGANFHEDWERPAHIEFYEPDGGVAFDQDVGIKIHGGWTRGNPQKSLAVFARSRYGPRSLDYKLFGHLDIDSFRAIVLRNSGNDWNRSMLRDAFMTGLIQSLDIDIQAYRPAELSLNGEYWGLHNVREKLNEDYLASHYDIDPEAVTIIENNGVVVEGDSTEYWELIDFLDRKNMALVENYAWVESRMDIDNFITYLVSRIYMASGDWLKNNSKCWKSHEPGSRWRWFLYDTDNGFSYRNNSMPEINTLSEAFNPKGFQNRGAWSTLIQRRLVQNEDFVNRLLNRNADLLNTLFTPERVKAKLLSMKAVIEPKMSRHFGKWGGTLSDWNREIDKMLLFADLRPGYCRQHYQSMFNISRTKQVQVHLDRNQGQVRINSILVPEASWNGTYFYGIPIDISAIANSGFSFVRWEGLTDSKSQSQSVLLRRDLTITPVFEADSQARLQLRCLNNSSS